MSICLFNCSDLQPEGYNSFDLLVSESLFGNNVLTTLGCIEVNWQFNSLRLVDSKRQIGLFLKVLESEAFQVLLREGLRVQDAGGGYFVLRFTWGARVVPNQLSC